MHSRWKWRDATSLECLLLTTRGSAFRLILHDVIVNSPDSLSHCPSPSLILIPLEIPGQPGRLHKGCGAPIYRVLEMIFGVPGGKTRPAFGHLAQPIRCCHPAPEVVARGSLKSPKMIPQQNNTARSRVRPAPARPQRPTQVRHPANQNQWQRNYDRYCQLAQSTADDAVMREHYWQHAEHFLRLMNGSASSVLDASAT